jgi:hypothetical protein
MLLKGFRGSVIIGIGSEWPEGDGIIINEKQGSYRVRHIQSSSD